MKQLMYHGLEVKRILHRPTRQINGLVAERTKSLDVPEDAPILGKLLSK